MQKMYGETLKTPGEYDDLYVQSDTLLLADVFENLIFEIHVLKLIKTLKYMY